MVRMRLGMDDEAHGIGAELLDRGGDDVGVFRALSGIDQDEAVARAYNRAVGFVEHGCVDVNSFFDLLEVRPEILRRRGRGRPQAKRREKYADRKIWFLRISPFPRTARQSASTLP